MEQKRAQHGAGKRMVAWIAVLDPCAAHGIFDLAKPGYTAVCQYLTFDIAP
jgi:hypothetical protein